MARSRTHTYDLTTLLPGPLYCAACAERVCGAVSGLPGVVDVQCDLDTGSLTVTVEGRTSSPADFDARVRRIALEETDRVDHAAYRLTGLD